jgi:flavine halogenase
VQYTCVSDALLTHPDLDASGWIWYIPLHTGKVSVGVVMNQGVMTNKKRANDWDSKEAYLNELKHTPGIAKLLEHAKLVTDIKSASEWSYSADAYASPYIRLAGDAGCFIDPFFSSGVHLALASGLSAAVTVTASIRGQVDELAAATWHSKKVAEGYTRFLLVVSSALKQIQMQAEPVLSDWDERSFERAFHHFRPIIQGSTDVTGKLSQSEVSETIDFCFKAFIPVSLAEKQAIVQRMEQLGIADPSTSNEAYDRGVKELKSILSPEQMRIMHTIRARQMLRSEDTLNMDNFGTDVIDNLSPNLVTGSLGLVPPKDNRLAQPDVLALMSGEEGPMTGQKGVAEDGTAHQSINADAMATNGASKQMNGNGTNEHHINGNGLNEHHVNGNGLNGHHINGNGLNGHHINGNGLNGHRVNGDGHGVDHVSGAPSVNDAAAKATPNGDHSHLKPLEGHVERTSSGEATRLKMQDTLHSVAEQMETPHDTMLRMFNSVSSHKINFDPEIEDSRADRVDADPGNCNR